MKIPYYYPILFFISFFFYSLTSLAQPAITKDQLISIGKVDSLYSNILGEQRKIWVHVPNTNNQILFGEQKYPVLYLLDGNAHFQGVTSILQQLGGSKIPQMIVVGIPPIDRTKEMTPTHVDVSRGDSVWVKTSGGGEDFTQFLEKELLPYIDSNYPTTSFKTYVGHSLGGLLVLNTLVHHPDLFDNYLAIDPSLWWDDQRLLKQATEKLSQEQYANKSLFLAVANTMNRISQDLDITNVQQDTTEMTLHIRSILEFSEMASANPQNNLAFSAQYYENENHGTVPFISTYDALCFLFSWYEMENIDQFNDPNFTVQESIDFINKHYQKRSRHFGYTEVPEEEFLNSIGYLFMNMQEAEKAFAFFNMNIEYHPESANVYDSMGDYYLSQDNKTKALEFFTKAYKIGKSPYTKGKMEGLK